MVKEYRPREFILKTPQPRHPIRSSERGGRSVLSEAVSKAMDRPHLWNTPFDAHWLPGRGKGVLLLKRAGILALFSWAALFYFLEHQNNSREVCDFLKQEGCSRVKGVGWDIWVNLPFDLILDFLVASSTAN